VGKRDLCGHEAPGFLRKGLSVMVQFNREKIEMTPLLEQVFKDIEPELKDRQIQFQKEISDNVGDIWGDKEKIKKLFNRLFHYTIKNIEEKGRMSVKLSGSEKYVRLEISGSNSESFSKKMNQIFNFFGDIKSDKTQDIQMWLSLLQDIIEVHKGKIWVEDELGEASKCILSLPRDLRKKIKIVIADDNPGICQTLKDILTEKEYLVDTVRNGYELVTYLRENNPKIVILDLMMPEKDGTEVFNIIRTIQQNIKIIIYTGFQRYENSFYARSAEKFLLKDANPEKLLEAIEELI